MMKKLAKLTALLAAAALLFGAVGCSDDDGGDGDGFPSKHETVDVKSIDENVTSVSKDVVFAPAGIATAAVDGTSITVTSLKAGKTTMTIKVSGEGYTDKEVKISITVAENGTITYKPVEDGEETPGSGDEGEETPGTPGSGDEGEETPSTPGSGGEDEEDDENGGAETPAGKTYTFTPAAISDVKSASDTDATVTVDGFVFTYNNVIWAEENYAASADATSFESAKGAYIKFAGKMQFSETGGKNYIAFTVPAGKKATVKAVLYAASNGANSRNGKKAKIVTVAGKTMTPVSESLKGAVMTTSTITSNGSEKYFGVPTETDFDKALEPTEDTTYYLGYDDTLHFTSVSVTLE